MTTSSAAHLTRQCPRTQLSRHDRIARIVRRNVQRCACELTQGPRGAGAQTRGASAEFRRA